MPVLDTLFSQLLDRNGSDLHLLQGQKPKMRVHGHLAEVDGSDVLDGVALQRMMKELCSTEDWNTFVETKDFDFAYQFGTVSRFRANYYFQHSGLAAVFRAIPHKILTLEDLGLPQILYTFAKQRSGLILVTGPTGSGKSTTLAAILNEINEHESRYILTIEEPIEFVHPHKKSYFCQREVGRNTPGFAEALRSASRLDCDVILVGELRDYDTISAALSAVSMGKLVLGTLHTNSAIKTIDRVIDVFPYDEQWKARNMLADSLFGVCAQILLKGKDGNGRVAANEILLNVQGVASSIRESNLSNIRNIMQSNQTSGMQLMDDAIEQHLKAGLIDSHEAYEKARDKKRFKLFQEKEGDL